MQLLPIFLIAFILAADAGLSVPWDGPALSGMWVTVLACAPMFVVPAVQWLWMCRCRQALNRGRVPGPIVSAERAATLARLLILVNHAVVLLVFGWLETVRALVGDLVLVDEVLVLAPALLAILFTWAVHYPMEMRVREALFIRRLDAGRPIYPVPSRWRYVWRQSQLHIFLLLCPILIIVGLSEVIEAAAQRWLEPEWILPVSQFATLAAGLVVFVLAPLLTRVLFTTEPLAQGPLREELSEICRRHRVRIRELLVWKTDGTMINAAVMGLLAPLRYVLITDALLESMRSDEVQAVMAHEIGHVRRHHMPWLVVCLLALLIVVEYVVVTPVLLLEHHWFQVSPDNTGWIDLGMTGIVVVLVILGFGWISRRFERQADTFAAQHLSGLGTPGHGHGPAPGPESEPAPPLITGESVEALRSALMTICQLNSMSTKRRSWRHGSVAWRIDYLESIIGSPREGLRIDRQIGVIKVLAAVSLVTAIAYETIIYEPAPAGSTETARQMSRSDHSVAESGWDDAS